MNNSFINNSKTSAYNISTDTSIAKNISNLFSEVNEE